MVNYDKAVTTKVNFHATIMTIADLVEASLCDVIVSSDIICIVKHITEVFNFR
jgi:hypothetical protein